MTVLKRTRNWAAVATLAVLLALLVPVALLVGCRFWALQPRAGAAAANATIPKVWTAPTAPAAQADGKGELRLRILWPDRDRKGFHAAAIPTSTSALVLRITKGPDEIVRKIIQRPADDSPSDVSLKLEAASNLSVEVKAYREADPDLVAATPIARGTAIVNIRASRTTAQTLKLDALFVPTIAAMSANAGAAGDVITLTGDNLAPVQGATPSVTFNGVNASVSAPVTPIDGTHLSVVVPQGAAVGRVVVTNDGIPSVSNAIYWVASELKIDAPKGAWDNEPADVRIVLFGTKMQIQSLLTWVLGPGASAQAYGEAPSPEWRLADATTDQISTTGEFTAGHAFKESTLTAKLGSLESNALELSVQEVVAVSLSPATATVSGLQDGSATYFGQNALSGGSTNSLVLYSSAEPASVSIDPNSGLAQAAGFFGEGGTVVITATSKLKEGMSATASATLVPVAETVAYYRPYRDRWLDALSKGSFEEAGGRRDNWWQYVNEDFVRATVEKVGWDKVYRYVKDETTADWQNHGVVFINPRSNQILGHLYVENSYDAKDRILHLLNKRTTIQLNTGTFDIYLSATSVLSS